MYWGHWKTYRQIRCGRCGTKISSNGLAQASHYHSLRCDARRAYNYMRPNGWDSIEGTKLRGLPDYLRPRAGGVRWVPRDLLRIFNQLTDWLPIKDIYAMLRKPEALRHWEAWAKEHMPKDIDL